jgi:hypothetical protein
MNRAEWAEKVMGVADVAAFSAICQTACGWLGRALRGYAKGEIKPLQNVNILTRKL